MDTSRQETATSANMENETAESDAETAGSIAETNAQPLRLLKNIGLVAGTSYTLGGIIGVGIFVSPQSVLINVGGSVGVAFCVWVFCAFTALCGALTYADLGTRISKSGGSYTYIKTAFGDWAGFMYLWIHLIIVRPRAIALASLVAAEYIVRPVFMDCPHLTPIMGKSLLALVIISFLIFWSAFDTRYGAAIQTVSTISKVAALLFIIAIGVFFLCKDGSDNFQDLFFAEGLTGSRLTQAVYACTYAYGGWDNLNIVTEEVRKPKRTVPLSILLAVGLTTLLYLTALVAYHAVLTTPQIMSGVAVAAVFTEVTVPPLMWVIVPCIALSATGIVNANVFTFSRITFIGGRDELFPEILSMISVSRRTPLVSCIVMGATAFIIIFLGDFMSVLTTYALARSSGEVVAILGFFRLRRKFPATKNTYKVPSVVPVIFLLVNASLIVVAVTRDTSRYVTLLLIALAGVPVYFLSKSRMCRTGPLKNLNDYLVDVCRKLLLCDYASKTY